MKASEGSVRHDLYAINMKAFAGEQLTEQELRFVLDLANSQQLAQAITANGVLFLAGNRAQKQSALERLKDVCQQGAQSHDPEAEAALIPILEFFPQGELESNPSCKEFAYRMAGSGFLPCRINVMHVLRRLAKQGDHRALSLLKQSTADADTHVRETAQTALKLLGESGVDAES